MTTQSRRRFMLSAGALGLMTSGSFAASPVRLQVLVARTSHLSDLSLADLRQIYKGKPLQIDGHAATPFNHPALTPDRVSFDRLVLRMGPEEVARYWVDQKIRSASAPPRVVDSVSLLLRVIARLPGAIGYVREGFSSPDLKVLAIDGRPVSDRTYPLIVNG